MQTKKSTIKIFLYKNVMCHIFRFFLDVKLSLCDNGDSL